jgi:Glycosyl hydrolase family 3 C-terminal domain
VPSGYLPSGQLALAQQLATISSDRGVPFVGVYVGGRDRLLAAFDALFDAHLAAFYPGPHGGAALARIVRGAASPSARLPITLHAGDAQNLPYWRAHADYQTIPPSIMEMQRRAPLSNRCPGWLRCIRACRAAIANARPGAVCCI